MTWYEYGNEVYYNLTAAWTGFEDADIVNREAAIAAPYMIEQMWAIREDLA